jgi:16S rRNA (cytosine1402-N4)-methyltransferase
MVAEVLELLAIPSGATIVDCTVGHGGHASAMLAAAGPAGRLIGFDWDEEMLAVASETLKNYGEGCLLVRSDFRAAPSYRQQHFKDGANAVLLDLGVNLQHFADESRGFSFQYDSQLDMRMARDEQETASAWLGRATEQQIVRTLRELGGERHAGRIARQIVERRREGKMKRTSDLVDAVVAAIPPRLRDKRIHPATRTFQAIRIQVNRELDGLDDAIAALANCLCLGGRMAVLSYHSGEDGAAKHAFKSVSATGEFRLLTRTPIRPQDAEVKENPSARSAKLRAIERIALEVQV